MRKIYLLVQNDIRTGPFTLKELLQQPLQSESLIWIIGESEDWLSPLEIPSLEPYFTQSESGDLLVNPNVVAEFESPSVKSSTAISEGADLVGSGKGQGLQQRTIMETAPGKATNTFSSNTQAATAERQTFKETVKRPDKEVEEEESSGLGKNKWPVLATISLLLLLIIWSILFNGNDRSKEPLSYSATSLPSSSEPSNSRSVEKVSTSDYTEEPSTSDALPIVVPAVQTAVNTASSSSTESFLDSVNRVLDSQDQLMAAVDEVYKKSFRYPKRLNKNVNQHSGNKAKSAFLVKSNKTQASTNRSSTPVSQQVALQSRNIRNGNKESLSRVEVMLKNNSKQVLKTVSVDVFYYKKGEHLLDKETVYFSNIYPSQSLTKSLPGNQKAISARLQLGTITLAERR